MNNTIETKGTHVRAFSDYGSFDFLTDMLIAKRDPEKHLEYYVVGISLYGTKTDLNKIVRKTSGASFQMKNTPVRFGEKFKISRGSNFDIEEDTGQYMTRLTLVRKKDMLLDETQKEQPIVLLPGSQSHLLKETVFEYVRESIVAPLFPNLTKPKNLAKELFITKDEAQTILENVQNDYVQTKNEKFAQDGIQKYYEWVDYLYDKLVDLDKLKELEVVCFDDPDVYAYEIEVEEETVKDIVSDGIKQGAISISNESNHWNHYTQFDSYMKRYAQILKQVIESQANPIHKNGDVRKTTEDIMNNLGLTPAKAQTNAVEGMVKSLDYQNKVDIVGEPGVGKTFMMTSAVYLDSFYHQKPLKALVLSPDHLVKTAWEKEIKNTFADTEYHHIRSIKDLTKLESKGYLDDNQNRVFILKQTDAKSGFKQKPAAVWDKTNKEFKCPDCYETVTSKQFNQKYKTTKYVPKYIDEPVDFDFFTSERNDNRRCKHCGSILWTANNKHESSFREALGGKPVEGTFLNTKIGFVPRDLDVIKEQLEFAVNDHNTKRNKQTENRIANLREIEQILEGDKPEKAQVSPYRVSVALYIKKKLKNRFSHLIIDEMHEYQSGGSSRTESAAQLIASVPKIVRGTGTMMNGYAKSRFYNDYMLFPEKMKKAGFDFNDEEKYQVAFGVTEKRYQLTDDGKQKKLSPKSKPGISPIIFPLFLQDSTIFIDFNDLEDDMPGLKHEVVEVDMTDELKSEKDKLENAVKNATKGDKNLFKGMMPMLYAFLDMPTVQREIKNEDKEVVFTTNQIDNSNDKKMNALKQIVRDEKLKGKRTIIYTHYTSDGINDYIRRKLVEEGYDVTVLNKEGEASVSCDGQEFKVKKDDRETFVSDEVMKDTDILVVNPTLIKTGTNLIDFSSIVYYQMGYQVYTIRQADRRTYRFGKEEDCTIYYLYYANSFQEDIASLMATKIVASESIEGNMDAKGLEAITNDRTPEEELAQKFFDHMGF